jgi:hypothetical protein
MADAEQVISAWREELRAGWGEGAHEATLDEMDRPLHDLVDGRVEPAEVLVALGTKAGRDGHPLDQVWVWLQGLFEHLPRAQRAGLDERALAVAIAGGWAQGVLDAIGESGPDHSPALLELRLRQLYEHCSALGLRAVEQYALVVVDVTGAGAPAAWLPDVVREMVGTFGQHEAVAVLRPDRVAIVVARHPSTAGAVQDLHRRLGAIPALRAAVIRAWVEPLAPDPSHLAGHLAGLRT